MSSDSPAARHAADRPSVQQLQTHLRRQLGPEVVVTDPAVMDGYRTDWTRDASAGQPLAVLRPRTVDEVQAGVRWAAARGIPIVPRGAGSGLSGGSLAVDGAVTLSLDRMTAIEIDVATRTAIVEPGALNAQVKAAAAEHGLWYPPDPSSFEICSIGGNVATNAGGLCCVKYGVTTDYVLGLDVVLADGTLVRLGGQRVKDVAGLSLVKLFVGSEGTLGIVTRAILRLVPTPPPPATLVASFPTVQGAADAVVAMCARVRPAMVELMDRASINAVEDYTRMGLDRSAGALLLVQSDAPGEAGVAEVAVIEAACVANGATEVFATYDPEEGVGFVAARRAAFPAVERLGSLLLEDVGVPVPLLPTLLTGIEDIAVRNGVGIPTVAHAGDGNTHPIVVFDAADEAMARAARTAFDEVLALAISLGGTITGEHGIGRLKRAALPDQLGPDVMALTRRIKDALDPAGILNPGAGF